MWGGGHDGFMRTHTMLPAGHRRPHSHTNVCSSGHAPGKPSGWADRPSPTTPTPEDLLSAPPGAVHYFNPHSQKAHVVKMPGPVIVLDTRLSNTARGDEWLPLPGAVATARHRQPP